MQVSGFGIWEFRLWRFFLGGVADRGSGCGILGRGSSWRSSG